MIGSGCSGLSTSHNSTLDVVSSVPSHGMFWVGGSKMKISRNYNTYKNYNTNKRGKVVGFSRNSRRRLMDKLARIDRSKSPLFATLTFADEHVSVITRHKRYLKAFIMRLNRQFPKAGLIWRLELETRKSGMYVGKVFPHYHLLIWGIGVPLENIRAWVSINWYEVCGEVVSKHLAAGTAVEQIRDHKGTFKYASKYLAKIEEGDTKDQGRYWGVCYMQNIPFVKGILCELSEEEAVKLIRYMRRFANLNGRDFKSLSVFCNVEFWYNNLARILYN